MSRPLQSRYQIFSCCGARDQNHFFKVSVSSQNGPGFQLVLVTETRLTVTAGVSVSVPRVKKTSRPEEQQLAAPAVCSVDGET